MVRRRLMLIFSAVILLFLLSSVAFLAAQIYGWPKAANFTDGSVLTNSSSAHNRTAVDPSRVKQVSWRPRAFVYKGFLTYEECDHLIILAKDKLEKSTVFNAKTGQIRDSDVRTSYGMFLRYKQDKIVAGIEDRIAAWTFLPPVNGEPIQILRYEHGQKNGPHRDYFHDKEILTIHHGYRIATVLMYLSEVAEGGETVFPNSAEKDNQPKGDNWSDCAKKGYSVKPKKGDALLFFSLHPDANTDPLSLHGSCPVIEGVKWSATKWIHVRPFRGRTRDEPDDDDNGCTDKDPTCTHWAALGECKKNPAYMVGDNAHPGQCKKSCKVCS